MAKKKNSKEENIKKDKASGTSEDKSNANKEDTPNVTDKPQNKIGFDGAAAYQKFRHELNQKTTEEPNLTSGVDKDTILQKILGRYNDAKQKATPNEESSETLKNPLPENPENNQVKSAATSNETPVDAPLDTEARTQRMFRHLIVSRDFKTDPNIQKRKNDDDNIFRSILRKQGEEHFKKIQGQMSADETRVLTSLYMALLDSDTDHGVSVIKSLTESKTSSEIIKKYAEMELPSGNTFLSLALNTDTLLKNEIGLPELRSLQANNRLQAISEIIKFSDLTQKRNFMDGFVQDYPLTALVRMIPDFDQIIKDPGPLNGYHNPLDIHSRYLTVIKEMIDLGADPNHLDFEHNNPAQILASKLKNMYIETFEDTERELVVTIEKIFKILQAGPGNNSKNEFTGTDFDHCNYSGESANTMIREFKLQNELFCDLEENSFLGMKELSDLIKKTGKFHFHSLTSNMGEIIFSDEVKKAPPLSHDFALQACTDENGMVDHARFEDMLKRLPNDKPIHDKVLEALADCFAGQTLSKSIPSELRDEKLYTFSNKMESNIATDPDKIISAYLKEKIEQKLRLEEGHDFEGTAGQKPKLKFIDIYREEVYKLYKGTASALAIMHTSPSISVETEKAFEEVLTKIFDHLRDIFTDKQMEEAKQFAESAKEKKNSKTWEDIIEEEKENIGKNNKAILSRKDSPSNSKSNLNEGMVIYNSANNEISVKNGNKTFDLVNSIVLELSVSNSEYKQGKKIPDDKTGDFLGSYEANLKSFRDESNALYYLVQHANQAHRVTKDSSIFPLLAQIAATSNDNGGTRNSFIQNATIQVQEKAGDYIASLNQLAEYISSGAPTLLNSVQQEDILKKNRAISQGLNVLINIRPSLNKELGNTDNRIAIRR